MSVSAEIKEYDKNKNKTKQKMQTIKSSACRAKSQVTWVVKMSHHTGSMQSLAHLKILITAFL